MEATGRFDDGSDDSLASLSLAERARKQNIGTLVTTPKVTLTMPITSASHPPTTFTCSRKWIVPRTIVEVSSGNLCLLNINYMVVDGELSTEDVLIGRRILELLKIDTNTLILSNYDRINNTDCGSVHNPTLSNTSTIRRIEAHISPQPENAPNLPTRPSINYHQARHESDFIYDPSLLASIGNSQAVSIKEGINSMLKTVNQKGLSQEHQQFLTEMTMPFMDIFKTEISPCQSSPI